LEPDTGLVLENKYERVIRTILDAYVGYRPEYLFSSYLYSIVNIVRTIGWWVGNSITNDVLRVMGMALITVSDAKFDRIHERLPIITEERMSIFG
jgi:hypothetical protein